MDSDTSVNVTILAGVIGGMVSTLAFYPLERIESQQQLGQAAQAGTLATGRAIVARGGVGALYAGCVPSTVGMGVNWAVYFGLMQVVGEWVHAALGRGVGPEMLVGVVAGCMTCCVVGPFWVLKYRAVQAAAAGDKTTASLGPIGLALHIGQTEGFSALWAGLLLSWLGSAEGAIQMVVYRRAVSALSLRGADAPFRVFLVASLCRMVAVFLVYPLSVLRAVCMTLTKQLEAEAASARKKDDDSASAKEVPTVPARMGTIEAMRLSARRVLSSSGVGGLYAGVWANMLRQAPAAGVLFVVGELVIWAFG